MKRFLMPPYALALAVACSSFDDGESPSGVSGGSCGVSTAPPDVGEWEAQATSFEQRVVELTNDRRTQGGCCGGRGCFDPAPPLSGNDNLRAAARLHARDMLERGYFAHDSPDGRSPFDRMEDAGFGGCAMAENIAKGQRSPEAVVESWMTSDGHCANILRSNFTQLGVGYTDGGGEHLWVQNFGG